MRNLTLALFVLIPSLAIGADQENYHHLVACNTVGQKSGPSQFSLVVDFDANAPDYSFTAFEIKLTKLGKPLAQINPATDPNSMIGYKKILKEGGEVIGREISFATKIKDAKSAAVALKGYLSLLDFGDSDYDSMNNVSGMLYLYTDEEYSPLNPPQVNFGVSCAAVSTTK